MELQIQYGICCLRFIRSAWGGKQKSVIFCLDVGFRLNADMPSSMAGSFPITQSLPRELSDGRTQPYRSFRHRGRARARDLC
jgi:hypothetical protein